MSDLVDCSHEELIAFVAFYPRPLERDVFGACEPPLLTFNDFTLGAWPESVVAQYHVGDDPDCGVVYYGAPSNFKIARKELT